MKLTLLQWTQMIAAALAITVMVMTARERIKVDRHCQMAATLIVDCWELRR